MSQYLQAFLGGPGNSAFQNYDFQSVFDYINRPKLDRVLTAEQKAKAREKRYMKKMKDFESGGKVLDFDLRKNANDAVTTLSAQFPELDIKRVNGFITYRSPDGYISKDFGKLKRAVGKGAPFYYDSSWSVIRAYNTANGVITRAYKNDDTNEEKLFKKATSQIRNVSSIAKRYAKDQNLFTKLSASTVRRAERIALQGQERVAYLQALSKLV